MTAKNNKWVRASVFVEYSLIIGAVALALAGMDYYIRRGIMSRTKDITDYIISPDGATRQENDSSPGREITSDSRSESSAAVNTHMYTGGGTGIETDSWQSTTATSNVVDRQTLDALPLPFDIATFIPWQGSAFDDNEVSRERYDQYFDGDHVSDVSNYDWENDDDPCRLGAEVNRLREKADALENNAQGIEDTNSNLITENNALENNPVIQFFQAILDGLGILRDRETELGNSAADMRRQAQELRDRADAIEARLATLAPCQG